MPRVINLQAGVLCLSLAAVATMGASAAPSKPASNAQAAKPNAQASACVVQESGSQKVAQQLIALLPKLRAVKNEVERESILRLAATSLARAREHEPTYAAYKVAEMIPQRPWEDNIRDEVQHIHARDLARFNTEQAMKIASEIQGEYARADVLLAIARRHLRAKNTVAAGGVLRQAETIIRESNSPLAISYLAWLFTRVGEDETARSLFQLAAEIKSPDEGDAATFENDKKRSIAFYQAKAGWNDDAFKTVGDDIKILPALKAVLIERRQGELLHRFAAKLPAVEAVTFLTDLSGAETATGQIQAARETLNLALARLVEVGKTRQDSADGIYIRAILSVLEIATGQENKGRARFAALSRLPNFTADHAATFYLTMVVPSRFVKVPLSPQQRVKDEKAALVATKKLKNERVYNFIEIAKVQQKRGDKTAMRETLKLAKSEIQSKIAKCSKEKPKDARRFKLEDAVAVGQLMNIAKIERDAGNEKAAQSTLAQAKALMQKHSQLALASALLNAGFVKEAGVLLERLAPLPVKKSADWISSDSLQSLGPRHARKTGADAALRWVVKIPDAQIRAATLSGILIALNPISAEERELILRGDKQKGARVSSQFSLSGYQVSESFNEFE